MANKLDFDKMPEPVVEQPKAEELKETANSEERKTDLLPFEIKDKKRYVVQITTGVQYDDMTGERIGKDFIQSYTPEEFKQFEATAEALGYKYIVRYMPNPKK